MKERALSSGVRVGGGVVVVSGAHVSIAPAAWGSG
jgi:hypothetical protein